MGYAFCQTPYITSVAPQKVRLQINFLPPPKIHVLQISNNNSLKFEIQGEVSGTIILLGLRPLYCCYTWVTSSGSWVYRITLNWMLILSLISTKINSKEKLKSSHVKTWWMNKTV